MEAMRNLEDVAIVIRLEKDNVAVVTVDFLEQGTTLNYRGESLTISGRVLRGQSFAIKKVGEGEPYITLGDPIGLASRSVEPGDPISESNLEDRLPKLAVRYRDNPGQPEADPGLASLTFDGFVRPDGSIGARNYVGVVTSGMCSSTEAHEIAGRAMREIYSREKYPNVDGVVPISQESGCGMPDGHAVDLLNQLLSNTMRHPNLGAAIYIDLGCGKTCVECSAPIFQNAVPNYNQRVANLVIQLSGGSRRTVERGLEITEKLLDYANQFTRQPAPISKLVVGTKCGGADRWSGVTANPAGPRRGHGRPGRARAHSRRRTEAHAGPQALRSLRAHVWRGFPRHPLSWKCEGRALQHLFEVERSKSQGRHFDCRRPGRIRRMARRPQGPLRALHTRLRPDLDARAVSERSAGGAVYHGARHRHRLRARAGDEDRLEFPARPHERRYRHQLRDHPRKKRDHRRGGPQDFPGDPGRRLGPEEHARRRSGLPHR